MTEGEFGDGFDAKNDLTRERMENRVPPPVLPEVVATFIAA